MSSCSSAPIQETVLRRRFRMPQGGVRFNLANTPGLEVPATLLARADKVIE
jgi:hypothetical protein